MSTKRTYRKLGPVIDKLNAHILSKKKSPYLSSVVGLEPCSPVSRTVTAREAQLRKDSLKKFQKSAHYRVVEPSVWNEFLKNLYPMRNSLTTLSLNREPSRQVNHELLFRSYCDLPRPGVAHMKYEDFEQFMNHMFTYRAFSKPNSLSGTNIFLYNDDYIVKQYTDAHTLRQSHLNTLWQITNDLDSAKIPTSESEQRNMIYKTFFRDRQDIMKKIKSIVERGNPRDAAAAKTALREWQSPDFDYQTYKDVTSRFDKASDPETLNVLLFTALRHDNTLAYLEIMSKFAPENFTRDTFIILLENLAFLGKFEDYTKYLSLLIWRHIALVDIQLLNITISSLVNLGEPELAISLVKHLSIPGEAILGENESFLKLIKRDDKVRYSSYIAAYDRLPKKPPVNYHPTEQSFLPILKHYCETGAGFDKLLGLLTQVESVRMLPITSQMFKHIFRGFVLHKYDIGDLQYMLGKLIEVHDLNSGSRDAWIRDQINDSTLPDDLSRFLNEIMTEPRAPGYNIEDNNFVKLSNGLVRQVFRAYHHTLGRHSDLKEEVMLIERELNEALKMAEERHKSRVIRDELEAVDLHERKEFVYIKKKSLLKLLDISPSP